MQVKVEKEANVIFEGDADDFLFENDSDVDLEIILNELEEQRDYSAVDAYDNNGDVVTITKIPLYVD